MKWAFFLFCFIRVKRTFHIKSKTRLKGKEKNIEDIWPCGVLLICVKEVFIDDSKCFPIFKWKTDSRTVVGPAKVYTLCNLIGWIFAGRSRSFLASDRWRLRRAFFLCLFVCFYLMTVVTCEHIKLQEINLSQFTQGLLIKRYKSPLRVYNFCWVVTSITVTDSSYKTTFVGNKLLVYVLKIKRFWHPWTRAKQIIWISLVVSFFVEFIWDF